MTFPWQLVTSSQTISLKSATWPVADAGFLYGECLYETLRTHNGHPWLWKEHLARLQAGAERLQFPPFPGPKEWERALSLALKNIPGDEDRVLRLLLTRGYQVPGWSADPPSEATFAILMGPLPPFVAEYYESGVPTVLLNQVTRTPPGAFIPALKLAGAVELRLGLLETKAKGGFEGFLLNHRGELTEGTSSNLFVVQSDGTLVTPPLSSGILDGVTRGFLLDHLPTWNLPVQEPVLSPADLKTAREIWMTSSLKGIIPVTRLDNKPVGNGQVGGLFQMAWGRLQKEMWQCRETDSFPSE